VGPCAFPAFDCVVFAGASLPLKAWPKANCIALVERLRSAGLSVALAGGPAEVDLASSVAARCPGAVALAGALDLAQTIDLISRARCVVTTDSFPGHVRSLAGGPTLVLFGATSPSLGFVPVGEGVQVATLDLGCSPCTRHGRGRCRFGNHACMARLSGAAVADWVMTVLGRCPVV
jgi:heptosyltransferase-2